MKHSVKKMLDKIILPKNKLCCLHYHELTEEELNFIISNLDPIKFLNTQIGFYSIYTNEMFIRFPYAKKNLDTLKSIIKKLDIFDKNQPVISLKFRKDD